MSFVVVGSAIEPPRAPVLAAGPFDDEEAADEFRRHLAATTTGRYTVLPLHTPER